MITVNIKGLSINKAFMGRRFKTQDYKSYEQELFLLLPKKVEIPDGELELHLKVGASSKASDLDNFLKPLIDILQKKYDFNDKRIYRIIAEKQDVKKGSEFISFKFEEYIT